ncbi:hypothetical protein H257_14785 [Aphanomyces astaci]|uniref:Uncharacterized protein n=1 Tax=Aphanomyces astaci TaxID=112090 RepID=W4FRW2_APHAT|nr:hypothetical protein H257_14785 [Aphanomyces astaci]ETV69549.1 hypothetical protein H257_14785 [Aphanomyces astaci]|eukprot:XP_009840973.1 hypothetical protein H257_14785 [Aphanomyces astaci]
MQRERLTIVFPEHFRCHITTKNARLRWDPEGPNEVYVKVAANTTQDKYVKLKLLNYNDVIAADRPR